MAHHSVLGDAIAHDEGIDFAYVDVVALAVAGTIVVEHAVRIFISLLPLERFCSPTILLGY